MKNVFILLTLVFIISSCVSLTTSRNLKYDVILARKVAEYNVQAVEYGEGEFFSERRKVISAEVYNNGEVYTNLETWIEENGERFYIFFVRANILSHENYVVAAKRLKIVCDGIIEELDSEYIVTKEERVCYFNKKRHTVSCPVIKKKVASLK